MKKSHVIAVILALTMLVSILPLGAMAASTEDFPFWLDKFAYNDRDAQFNDFDKLWEDWDESKPDPWLGNIALPFNEDGSVDISEDDYEKFIRREDGSAYDFMGIGNPESNGKIQNGVSSMHYEPFYGEFIKTDENGNELFDETGYPIFTDEYLEWVKNYGWIILAYAPHEHALAYDAAWSYDNNNHWKYCKVCHQIVMRDWHQDLNNDGVCDFCKNPITYRTVTVKDSEGGKVQVSKDKAQLGDRIDVTVTPDAGYHLSELHFYNDNEQHSELTRYEDVKGTNYHFIVLPWNAEVEAVFVKD